MQLTLSERTALWAVECLKRRRRHILIDTIDTTKKGAIKKGEKMFECTWNEMVANGWKVTKMSVTAISVW